MMQPPADAGPAVRSLVLIVEDEQYARRALALLLQHCGYRTQATASAEEALSMLGEDSAVQKTFSPQIVLVDYNLPGLNGVEFIRRIKQLRPGIIPVLITSAPQSEIKPAEQELQFTYLAKPLEFRSLLRVLDDVSDVLSHHRS